MNETILIVDDEPAILGTLSDVLKDEGYHVLTATSGMEALNLLQHENPAVILLDIWMPDRDGLDTLQLIKRHLPPADR